MRVGSRGQAGARGGVGRCSRCQVRPCFRLLDIRGMSAFLRRGGRFCPLRYKNWEIDVLSWLPSCVCCPPRLNRWVRRRLDPDPVGGSRVDIVSLRRTLCRILRELFMDNIRRGGKKGALANISANCSRIVHEQFSPGEQKRGLDE